MRLFHLLPLLATLSLAAPLNERDLTISISSPGVVVDAGIPGASQLETSDPSQAQAGLESDPSGSAPVSSSQEDTDTIPIDPSAAAQGVDSSNASENGANTNPPVDDPAPPQSEDTSSGPASDGTSPPQPGSDTPNPNTPDSEPNQDTHANAPAMVASMATNPSDTPMPDQSSADAPLPSDPSLMFNVDLSFQDHQSVVANLSDETIFGQMMNQPKIADDSKQFENDIRALLARIGRLSAAHAVELRKFLSYGVEFTVDQSDTLVSYYEGPSIKIALKHLQWADAAPAVIAHEMGHAIYAREGYMAAVESQVNARNLKQFGDPTTVINEAFAEMFGSRADFAVKPDNPDTLPRLSFEGSLRIKAAQPFYIQYYHLAPEFDTIIPQLMQVADIAIIPRLKADYGFERDRFIDKPPVSVSSTSPTPTA